MSNTYRKVCVVGAGPAGLAAAIALRRNNCVVSVLDCATPPIDKACGEGLMPDSVLALRELGIEIPADVGFSVRGIRFADRCSSVLAEFPNGSARGVRRTILQHILIQHAKSLGVSITWNAKHVRLTERGLSLDGQFLAADLVVGADGQKSQIRCQALLNQVASEDRRYAFRRHYRVVPWSCHIELHWGERAQIYITPVGSEEICVAAISRDPRLRLEHALREVPEAKQRLKNAVPVSVELGALSISRTLKSVRRDNVILIGDASGSVDAITGEGMCLAFKQALALAKALQSGDLRVYDRLHQKLMKRPQNMASLLLALERNGEVRRRAMAGLARYPKVFESLLAVHVGAASFRTLGSQGLLHFGRAFLAAQEAIAWGQAQKPISIWP